MNYAIYILLIFLVNSSITCVYLWINLGRVKTRISILEDSCVKKLRSS